MLPFYMTAETRQALIAESNRLIAARSALHASRARSRQHVANSRDTQTSLAPETGVGSEASSDSAFARLVTDLQSS